MKAYKFRRSYSGVHWAMGGTEQMTYFPDVDTLFYNAGNEKKICTVEQILKEVKEYIDDIKSNKIKKNNETAISNSYSSFLKEIPEHTVGNTTFLPVSFNGFEEIDIDITEEKLKEIILLIETIKSGQSKINDFFNSFSQFNSK